MPAFCTSPSEGEHHFTVGFSTQHKPHQGGTWGAFTDVGFLRRHRFNKLEALNKFFGVEGLALSKKAWFIDGFLNWGPRWAGGLKPCYPGTGIGWLEIEGLGIDD